MIGKEVTNVSLTANSETIIEYPDWKQHADIVNFGPGEVFVNWRGPTEIDNPNCLKLTEGMSYELRSSAPFSEISIIGSQAAAVQVVIR